MLTVRLLLALCNIHGLHSKSIHFVLEFPQADLDVDIWMELPMGIVVGLHESKSRGYVLKLKKSLYGLKQASLNWFEKLKQGLTDRGFSPSAIDPCLYLKANMILLTMSMTALFSAHPWNLSTVSFGRCTMVPKISSSLMKVM